MKIFAVVFCLALVALVFVAVRIFNLSLGTVLLWGVFLACPLLHLWMMKDGGNKH
ncbi:MAG: DUF2933 domain-containing protein [Candidatus Levybacteria bacterium]|nr:DUF2933 domain-containing protein [Candidatus Levybacteria bacterium]